MAALISAALVFASTMIASMQPASGATSTTLTVQAQTPFSTFNPFTAYFGGDLDVISTIYPTLAYLGTDLEPHPYLADSWTTSSDKLTWTFKIHKGLKWSDGQPLTAKDAAWTYNLMMTNKAAATANGGLIADFASVTAPDDTTLIIKTKVPQANLLYVSTPTTIPVVPEHIWQGRVANLGKETNLELPVVGYGPWKLTGYKADQYAILEANKSFFLGAPKYDKLIDTQYKNSDAAVAALKSGQLNQMDPLTNTQYKALKGASGITTSSSAGITWTAVEVNSGARTKGGKPIGDGNPILKDPVVRRAINFGIDRNTLVDKVLGGAGVATAAYLPKQYTDNWQPSAADAVTFDPSKANQMLDAAGYKKGSDGIRTDPKTGKRLSFRLGTHSDEPIDAQVAGYLVGWMKDIGIKLNVQSLSFSLLNADLSKGTWDMLFDRWGTTPDPTYLLSIQTCGTLPDDNGQNGNTDSFFCDPAFDKLYAKQTTQFDPKQRMDTIHQMLAILYKADADLILYYADDLSAVTTNTTTNFYFGKKDANGNIPPQNVFLDWKEATPAGSSSSSSSNTGVIVLVVVIVVVVLAGGGFFFWRRRSAADSVRE
jgi:peptide/nickel transport system substrate-binding protein